MSVTQVGSLYPWMEVSNSPPESRGHESYDASTIEVLAGLTRRDLGRQ